MTVKCHLAVDRIEIASKNGNRSRAIAAGQAHFSQQVRVQRVFDHSKPVIDPEKNEPVPARERLPKNDGVHLAGLTFSHVAFVLSWKFVVSHLLTGIARRGNRSVWKQLADQWALITGASSGLGAEFARQLAPRGMHLVLVARRGELMRELADELHTKHGTRCEIIIADLSDPVEPQRILDEITSKGIAIELLVNNAGFGVVGEVGQADVNRLLELIRLNISALTELTYRILPGMIERGHGAILNVSSLSAFQPVAYMGVYAASKAFVLHFSESLHCELRDRGITVTAVCPGVTRTNFFEVAGAPGWLQKHSSLPVDVVVKKSLKALARRHQYVVPGWKNFLLTILVRIATRRRVVKESMRFFRPRRRKNGPE